MNFERSFFNRLSPLLSLGLVVFVVALGFAVYTALSSASMDTEAKLLDASIADLTEQTQSLTDKGVATALSAKDILEKIDKEYLVWSKVIQRIQTVVPKNAQSRPKVDFLSYSGGKDGALTLTSKTSIYSFDPYKDTAELLRAFNGSEYFEEAFIPAVSKSISDSGSTSLNYSLQLKFVDAEEKTVSRRG